MQDIVHPFLRKKGITGADVPTPVSALIHAATMVTAGVYQLQRFSLIFEWSDQSQIQVVFFGSVTAIFGAVSGQVEYDQKKVIAYSTTSQQGYMVVAAGLSQYNQALFHQINHAFFKALQFLSAGAVIHAVNDEQDFRKMGGLIYFLPKTYTFIQVGSLSLTALPFFTGFYSKDQIQEVAWSSSFTIAYIATLQGALFTTIYSIRLILQTFLSPPLFSKTQSPYISDPESVMIYPLYIQAQASVFQGSLTYDQIQGIGTSLYGSSLFTHPNHVWIIDAEFLPFLLKILPGLPLIFLLFLVGQKKENKNFSLNRVGQVYLKNNNKFALSQNGLNKTRNYSTKIIRNNSTTLETYSSVQTSALISFVLASLFIILSLFVFNQTVTNDQIYQMLTSDWSILYNQQSDIAVQGITLYQTYSIAFIQISLALLLVMIGVLQLIN